MANTFIADIVSVLQKIYGVKVHFCIAGMDYVIMRCLCLFITSTDWWKEVWGFIDTGVGGLGCNVRLKWYKWRGVFQRNLVHFLRSTYFVRSTHWNDFYLKQKSFIGTQNMVDSRHREVIVKGQRSVNPYLGWTASFFMSHTDIIWQSLLSHSFILQSMII